MPGFRLLVPYLPFAAVVVAFGWVGLAGALARRWAWAGPAAVISLVPLAFLAQEGERRSLKNQVGTRTAGGRRGAGLRAPSPGQDYLLGLYRRKT